MPVAMCNFWGTGAAGVPAGHSLLLTCPVIFASFDAQARLMRADHRQHQVQRHGVG